MKRKAGRRYARKKRGGDKDLKKAVRRAERGKNILINPMKFSLKSPLPEGYYTTFTCKWTCTVATNLPALGSLGDLQFNNPFTPFSVLPSLFRVGVDEATAYNVKNPAGLTNIIGTTALYNSYHVVKAKLKITYIPEAIGDSMIIGIAPELGAGTGYGSMGSLEDGPMSSVKTITTNLAQKDQSVYLTVDMPKYLGVTVQQYIANPLYGGNFSSGPSGLSLVIARARYATLDGSPTTFVSCLKYEIVYDVYCHSITGGGLNDA